MTTACVDHLVVLASDLASGVAWCEQHLGVTPQAGGEHPLMGTHNRLLNISSAAHPRAYLEILAINLEAEKSIPSSARRWFDMDDVALQQQVSRHGPQLIAWVASVPDLSAASAALAQQGLDCGPAVSASRPTPSGLLTWQISIRSDGQRLMQGCLPTLIQWGDTHPCDRLPPSGVQLQSLVLEHPQTGTLRAACASVGLAAVAVRSGPAARLHASLNTPRGSFELLSSVPA